MAFYTQQSPGRTVRINGREFLYFGGTSYLGIPADPEFRSLMVRTHQGFGASHGASRLSNLRLEVYEAAETRMAALSGSETALLLSSGFLAGQLLANYFQSPEYQVFLAPNAHAALSGSGRTAYPNFRSLAEAIKKHILKNAECRPVLFMDSLDFSGNSYPEYRQLQELPLHELILVADDSHGLGVLGEMGGGAYQNLARLGARELLVCASLGKALGVQAGIIFCSQDRRSALWETPFFAGASPPPPAHMASLTEAGKLYEKNRKKLLENIRQFKSSGKDYLKSFQVFPNEAVYAYHDPDLTSYLEKQGILVTDFSYPSTQTDTLPGRIVLNARHTVEDLRILDHALSNYYNGS